MKGVVLQEKVEHLNPSGANVVALEKPTEEKKAMVFLTRLNAMQYILNRIQYKNKAVQMIGKLDPLLVGHSNVIYENGEHVTVNQEAHL